MMARRVMASIGTLGLMAGVLGGVGVNVSAATHGKQAVHAKTSGHRKQAVSRKKWTIVLSNNYMANEWRPQMENDAVVVARELGDVNLRIVNAPNTISGQISSLQDIIATHPNAIVVDAASATALNPVLEEAVRDHIVVVSFDEVVTAPHVYKLGWNYYGDGIAMANWLGYELHGHGNIFMDLGLPGIPISQAFVKAWNHVLKTKYPKIHVVGTYDSEYSPGPELQAISNLLAVHPNVQGVLSGAYPSSIIKAFKQVGKKPLAVTGLATNGNMVTCLENHVPGFFFSAPTWVGGEAIQMAVNILEGKHEPMFSYAYTTNFQTNANHIPGTGQVVQAKVGVNVFPKLSPALLIPISFGRFHITPAEALGKQS
ncbi:MAG: substrate-binding domain-containing protein [Firmicutes bacterium]|nr:substrate-binding domain-containing protein [Bacillota bacterium]